MNHARSAEMLFDALVLLQDVCVIVRFRDSAINRPE